MTIDVVRAMRSLGGETMSVKMGPNDKGYIIKIFTPTDTKVYRTELQTMDEVDEYIIEKARQKDDSFD